MGSRLIEDVPHLVHKIWVEVRADCLDLALSSAQRASHTESDGKQAKEGTCSKQGYLAVANPLSQLGCYGSRARGKRHVYIY
jgi:hypothetical protein